jgi:hypothetical protein
MMRLMLDRDLIKSINSKHLILLSSFFFIIRFACSPISLLPSGRPHNPAPSSSRLSQ